MEKYKYKLQDNIFDEDNWNNYYLPIINEKINESISLIPKKLIHDIDSQSNIVSRFFNCPEFSDFYNSEDKLSLLRMKYAVIDTLDAKGLCKNILIVIFNKINPNSSDISWIKFYQKDIIFLMDTCL